MDEFGTSFPRRAAAAAVLADIYAGAVTERAVAAVAALGVADALADDPVHVDALADKVGAAPGPLLRVLRLLSQRGVFVEAAPETFGHTPASTCLRSDVPWSLRWTFLASGLAAAGPEVATTLRTGGSAYEQATGRGFWEALDADAAARDAFLDQMRCEARTMTLPLVERFDWAPARHVVDVGGGQGHVLAAVLRHGPHLRGTLVERPAVAATAAATFERAGVGDRVTIVGGDFFADVPAGADAYLLSRVLHDWDDAAAQRLLQRIGAVMGPAGSVLVFELLAGENAQRALVSDVLMLFVFGGGRERRLDEIEALLARAGLQLDSVEPGMGGMSLIVGRR